MSDETLLCEVCGRPKPICVCDRVVPVSVKTQLLILQHPQERDYMLGSAQLVAASSKKAKIEVGLSWRSLKHALDDPKATGAQWAVIFPDKRAKGDASVALSASGEVAPIRKIRGLIVLDGSWSQAKTLWWRNPWLSRLTRLSLVPKEPSLYGKMRKEPKKHYVSTLESIATALEIVEQNTEASQTLRRLFRTMLQRARDAKAAGEA